MPPVLTWERVPTFVHLGMSVMNPAWDEFSTSFETAATTTTGKGKGKLLQVCMEAWIWHNFWSNPTDSPSAFSPCAQKAPSRLLPIFPPIATWCEEASTHPYASLSHWVWCRSVLQNFYDTHWPAQGTCTGLKVKTRCKGGEVFQAGIYQVLIGTFCTLFTDVMGTSGECLNENSNTHTLLGAPLFSAEPCLSKRLLIQVQSYSIIILAVLPPVNVWSDSRGWIH